MNTRERIIEKSKELFLINGFDNTSIATILEELNIGKGTLYYYFESKEAILDEVVENMNNKILKRAEDILEENLPVYEKLIKVMTNLSIVSEDETFLKNIHKPQNALFNEKSNKHLIKRLSFIIKEIIEQGIEEKKFNTPYPLETSEMIIAHVLTVFDFDEINYEMEIANKVEAFIYNLGKLLGDGSDEFVKVVMKIFNKESIKE